MPTFERVEAIYPVSSGIETITFSETEMRIASIPYLTEWFDPAFNQAGNYYIEGASASAFKWMGKRNGVMARAFNTAGNKPNLVTFGPKTAPGVEFGANGLPTTSVLNGSLIVDDVPLFGSSYAFGFGFGLDAGAVGAMIGSAEDTSGFIISIDSSGRFTVSHNANLGFVVRDPTDRRGTVGYAVCSFDQAAQSAVIRINGQPTATATGITSLPDVFRLRIGGTGSPTGQSPAANLRLGQILPFNQSLHIPGRETPLGLVEAHLASLYT